MTLPPFHAQANGAAEITNRIIKQVGFLKLGIRLLPPKFSAGYIAGPLFDGAPCPEAKPMKLAQLRHKLTIQGPARACHEPILFYQDRTKAVAFPTLGQLARS